MFSRLVHQQETLEELSADLTEEQWRQRPDTGKWSVFENSTHLAAYQPVFSLRIERILREPNPAFERYVADQDPLFHSFLERSPDDLLRTIREDRSLIAKRLGGLDPIALARTGTHPLYGLLTLREWTEFFLLHEAHHLHTIFKLTRDLRKRADR